MVNDFHPEDIKYLLDYEILVDCYDCWEVVEAWKITAEERLHFPFKARIDGQKVVVLSLLEAGVEEEEESFGDPEIIIEVEVQASIKKDRWGMPLEELEVLDAEDKTAETIAAWKFWKNR